MKGIILAGGRGTRLMPVTKVTNKHLLPVYNKPMIYYPLETLIAAGIKEVLIVSGEEHAADFQTLLGDGADFGVKLSYQVQSEAGGIAQALALGETFAAGGPVAVHLGDNIFQKRDQLITGIKEFEKSSVGAMLFFKDVSDPERFGVAQIEGDRVTRIVEKPKKFISRFAVTGFYLYDKQVFDIIRTLEPSARGELEITDVNNVYVERGEMRWIEVQGEWTDAGTFDSLLRANEIAARLFKN